MRATITKTQRIKPVFDGGTLTPRAALLLALLVAPIACGHPPAPVHPPAPAPLPHASEDHFAVAIAGFEHDPDENHDGIGDIGAAYLQSLRALGPEILQIHQPLPQAPPNQGTDPAYAAHEQARAWLERMDAHVLIWGQVAPEATGQVLHLHLTGTRDADGGSAYPLAQDLHIPAASAALLLPAVQMTIAAEAGGHEELEGRDVRAQLGSLIERVEALSGASGPPMSSLLGYAMHAHGAGSGGLSFLQRAEQKWMTAGAREQRAEHPVAWSLIQAARGSVLIDMDAIEPDTGKLRQAEGLYRLALEEGTRERVPLDWAHTQNHLGRLYRRLAERLHEKDWLCKAVDAHHQASAISFDGDVPRYMDVSLRGIQRNLEDLAKDLPAGEKPACIPPLDEGLWRTFLAGEGK